MITWDLPATTSRASASVLLRYSQLANASTCAQQAIILYKIFGNTVHKHAICQSVPT